MKLNKLGKRFNGYVFRKSNLIQIGCCRINEDYYNYYADSGVRIGYLSSSRRKMFFI